MPLSPDEQRILDEIEQRLAEEDPRLVEAVSRTSLYTHLARRIKWSLLAFLVGFLMLMLFLMVVPDLLWVAATPSNRTRRRAPGRAANSSPTTSYRSAATSVGAGSVRERVSVVKFASRSFRVIVRARNPSSRSRAATRCESESTSRSSSR